MNILAGKHFRKFRKGLGFLSVAYLLLLLLLALLADWLPLGFTPKALDSFTYMEPFRWDLYKPGEPFHWLGTDGDGHDLLAVLIYGARTALQISFPAMVLASFVGTALGILAGYFGDTGLRRPIGKWLSFTISLLFFLFYAFGVQTTWSSTSILGNSFLLRLAILALISFLLSSIISYLLLKVPLFKKAVSIPFDFFLLKTIEVLGAVPRLLLILCLAAFFPFSVGHLVLIGMLTFWPGIARLARAEMLKQKELPYIEAAVSLGYTPARILIWHALPNMLVPIIVAVTFGICNLIALESTLTFLGYGLPPETPSWGQAIKYFKENAAAWWLLVFPGICILSVVLAIQNVSNQIIQKLQPTRAY